MRIRIFKNFYIHPTICVAQFLLIFRTKGTRAHRVLGRLYSPFPFSLPLEKPATKVTYTCRWMSDIYQFGCCAKAAQGIVSACLVGVWRERQYTKGLTRLHSPISSPLNTFHARSKCQRQPIECFHVGHIGVPKQWNSGHVGVPNQSFRSWTLFLSKRFPFLPINLHRCWPPE